MPLLTTKRLVLREMVPADLDALYTLLADVEVTKFIDTGPFADVAEARPVMDWVARIFAEQRGLRWVIANGDAPDLLIGTCGYNTLRAHNHSGELGYELARDRWGRGIMVEALTAMIAFGFDQLALNRIDAGVTVGNERSARVLAKLGFTEEGVIRAGGYWRGAYQDLRSFSLLAAEWEGVATG